MVAFERVLKDACQLEPIDQLRLLEALAGTVRNTMTKQPKRSILELRGKGKEIWSGIDAQEFVNQERDSWSG